MNWKIMTNDQKLEAIKQMKAEGLMLMETAEKLQITRSIVSNFAKKYGITWVRGGRDSNQNAAVDGQGKNTILRLTRRVLITNGRCLYKCERCYYAHPLKWALPRHHKDRNRTNNQSSNLEVLCLSCHSKEHLDERTRSVTGQFQANCDCGGS